jgi:hypothetical protein
VIDQRRLLQRVRLTVRFVAIGVVVFFVWRYDLVRLPSEGCSPLVAYAPGDRLVVDRHPGAPGTADAVLFRGPEDELLLGLVTAPPESAPEDVWRACAAGALWIVAEREDCPSADSRRLGPIARERIEGRIAFALPW